MTTLTFSDGCKATVWLSGKRAPERASKPWRWQLVKNGKVIAAGRRGTEQLAVQDAEAEHEKQGGGK